MEGNIIIYTYGSVVRNFQEHKVDNEEEGEAYVSYYCKKHALEIMDILRRWLGWRHSDFIAVIT